MAINLDINASSVFQARDAVRELEQSYSNLTQKVEELNKVEKENGRLTIEQQKAYEALQKEMQPLNAELNQLYSTMDDLDPHNLTASFEDMYGSLKPLSTQIGELEDRLYQMRLAGEANSEEFSIISERVGVMKATIKETDKEIDILSANKGIGGLRTQFDALGTSLLDLNFDNANRSLQGMSNTLKGIDGKKVGADMLGFAKNVGGTLVQAIGSATKVVMGFTTALLANPIVLIATSVIALGVAIWALKDKVQIFTVIFDMLGEAVGFVGGLFQKAMDLINKFTDWLGITNVQEQKLADERATRAKEEQERIEAEETIKSNALSNELRILEAKGVNTAEEIEQARYLKEQIILSELAKTEAKKKAVEAEIALLGTKRNLTDEEKEQLDEQKKALDALVLTIDNINTDIELNNINAEKRQQKLIEDSNKVKEESRKKAHENWKKAEEKRRKEAEDLAKLRESALKAIEEIGFKERLDSMETDYDRQLAITLQALEKERVEILKNKTLTKEEIEKINKYYDSLENKANADRNKAEQNEQKKVDEINNKALDTAFARKMEKLAVNKDKELNLAIEYAQEQANKDKELRDRERDSILEDEKLTAEQRSAIKEYYDQEDIIAQERHNEALSTIRADFATKQIEEDTANRQMALEGFKTGLASVESEFTAGYTRMLEGLSEGMNQMYTLLNDTEASVKDKAIGAVQIALDVAQQIIGGIQQAQQQALAESLENLDTSTNESISRLEERLNSGVISQEQFSQQKYQLELQAYNKEEAMRKKAFEQDKKMKLAQASIAMVTGMVSAFTGAMQLGPIAGPIVGGILAAAVGVMGAINISKIKSTRYESGTPPSAPAPPQISTPEVADNRNVQALDSGYSSSTSSGGQAVQQSEPPKVEVVASVSITELDNVQGKVNNYALNGEL